MKKLMTLALALLLMQGLVSCGAPEDTAEPEPIVNPVNLTMEIVIGLEEAVEDGFEGLEETAFIAEEGTNLQDATQLFCMANELTVTIDERKGYLTELMGLTEKDYHEGTGWIFKVNGEIPTVPAQEVIVVENDKITREFVDFNTYSW